MECIGVETYFAQAADTQTDITQQIRKQRTIRTPLLFGKSCDTTFIKILSKAETYSNFLSFFLSLQVMVAHFEIAK